MTVYQNFLKYDRVFKPNEARELCEMVKPHISYTPSKNKTRYLNIPAAFDIETTSFFQLVGKIKEKRSIMYVWTLSICGLCIMGRTWEEFVSTIDIITSDLKIDLGNRLIIYVHNLSFDFSFFRKWFEWVNVFALDSRKPVYALAINGVEFRCSYLLSSYSLDIVSKNLRTYDIKKLVGDLDYSLKRHSGTVLSNDEISYCLNDVKIIIAYIAEKINDDSGIQNIPLTNTGYVRNYCRNMCFGREKGERGNAIELAYKHMIHKLNVSLDEYYQLKRAFQGGFTHANPFYVGKILENVSSYDFTSSYPYVIVSEKYPMSSAELLDNVDEDIFEYSINNYCCLFDVEFYNLQPIIIYENYISRYRCRNILNGQYSNGRIVKADYLRTTITEQDYEIIKRFYKWDKMGVANFRRYKKGYLPRNFIRAVLSLYADKTTLKGVKGKEMEYNKAKTMINACYGMMVTDIVRDEILYINNMWPNEYGKRADTENSDPEKAIGKYNNSQNRFLFYPWGVWVTAYARRNLFTGILAFGDDYVYSDTDSIKALNADKHKDYIDGYNFNVRLKLYKALQYHKLSIDMVEPATMSGIKKMLGAWDYEGQYKRFKTLGAKRYMIETDKGVNITVSGLNKSVCVPYIIEKSGNKPFEFFNNNMDIPGEYTGKQTHTYIDNEMNGVITDYRGVKRYYHELSGVHLENSPYSMSLSQEFRDYLLQIKTIEGV